MFVVAVNPQSEEMEVMLAVKAANISTEHRMKMENARTESKGAEEEGREWLAAVDLHITSHHSGTALC